VAEDVRPLLTRPLLTRPLLTRIDHVGVAVRDLDAAIEFYERVFGLQVVHEEVNEDQGVREAMLAVGDSGSCIQLLAPLSDESPIARFLERSGEGVQQVAYGVEDVAAASAALREAGLRLLYDEPRRGTAGSRINFIHPKDAGGVLVELVEAPTPAPTPTPPGSGVVFGAGAGKGCPA
jgi:methylmalonyl-CoA/ethylmalonyl-CoA epimerase